MRQTLFTVDDFWLLVGWLVLGIAYFVYQLMKGDKSNAMQFLPVYLIGAALMFFVFPKIETLGVNDAEPNGPLVPIGLAIRGYGLFLLLAMVAGFGLALYRCHQVSFDGDKILSLGFWMVVFGLVGARLFYVIQKFESFSAANLNDLIFSMVDMTSGGLVVYGSLIGGVLAAIVFLVWNKMPWRTVADILAPGMILGLAIGRIGCLMNGCCYGGVCDAELPGIQFPAGSAPYIQQLRTGKLIGIDGFYDEPTQRVRVEHVLANSPASDAGVQPGDNIQLYLSHPVRDDVALRLRAAKGAHDDMKVAVVIETEGESAKFIAAKDLPNLSLRTHPTQIYSAINAGLLCMFLWFYFPYRKNPGEVFALFMSIYPIGRFLLEIVRRDELGQFGTRFTISQWISFGIFVFGVALFLYVRAIPEKDWVVAEQK